MNINISTTQWGGARGIADRPKRPLSVGRNLVLALTAVTLAGFLAIQALGIAPVVNQTNRGAEVVSGADVWAGEVLSADEILRVELDKGAISAEGGGSLSLPK